MNDTANSILPGVLAGPCPVWPPDLFAVAATLLKKGGGYLSCVHIWPPSSSPFAADYANHIGAAGEEWRRSSTPPSTVEQLWNTVRSKSHTPIDELQEDMELCAALVQLVAVADEASAGLGLARSGDAFISRGRELLFEMGRKVTSACHLVHHSRAVVLPKMHTPQVGMTVRSLSHHLALWDSAEVLPEWHLAPGQKIKDRLNLLLLPWPLTLTAAAFRETKPPLSNMPREYAFFGYDPVWDRTVALARIRELIASALKESLEVDAIVLPEMSLPDGECARLAEQLGKIVIGGEHAIGTEQGPSTNTAVVAIPQGSTVTMQRQHKHHRWQLSRSQINWYGLGLDPAKFYWEYMELKPRRLHFWCLNSWLAFSVLICEDLARQEPVAELVRAVGPNLVVALLMDGSQKSDRWSARYATVLADDPGCSVLTMSSVGMTTLGKGAATAEARQFALWKDQKTGLSPIKLELGAQAVLVRLKQETATEWTADGRDDGGVSGTLVLEGMHQLK